MKKTRTEKAAKHIGTIMLAGVLLLSIALSSVLASDLYEAEETEAEETEAEEIEAESAVKTTAAGIDDNAIGGVIWLDENENGAIDPAEPMISEFPVSLYQDDQMIATTITDVNGSYQFENLTPGEYVIEVQSEIVNGTEYLIPLCGIIADNRLGMVELENEVIAARSDLVTVTADTQVGDLNAGMRLPAGIVPTATGNYSVSYTNASTWIGDYDTLKEAVDNCPPAVDCTITVGQDDVIEEGAVIADASSTITLTSATTDPCTITMKKTTTNSSDVGARHLCVEGSGSLILDNIILAGVGLDADDGVYNGGVYVDGGHVAIVNEVVIEGCSNYDGGGIYLDDDSDFEMNGGIVVRDNSARNSGGGVYMGADTEVYMADAVVADNRANDGGGVYVAEDGYFEMGSGEISDNEAENNGGGVYVAEYGYFEMEDGIISGNTVENNGGGVYLAEYGYVEVVAGEISGNTAENNGGGVYAAEGSYFEMGSGEISGDNEAANGGGVYVAEDVYFYMTDGAISDNAAENGGGVYVAEDGYFEMEDGVISDNEAVNGGGVYLEEYGYFEMLEDGEISDNAARTDGGGIYTEDYDYDNPVSTSAYANIEIDGAATVAGNTAGNTYVLPVNYTDFSDFPGELLNNDQINYKGYYIITYDANNGKGESQTQNVPPGTGAVSVTLLTDSDTNFTPPSTDEVLIGWNTEADGTGQDYGLGATTSVSGYLTLYAVWRQGGLSYDVNVDYYYVDDSGASWYTGRESSVVTDGTIAIDTGSIYILPSYTAWYYTVGPDHDVKYYFADVGNVYSGIDDDITINVYAVNSVIDVTVPNDSFFWYANEDTSTQVDYLMDPVTGQLTSLMGSDVVYEIRSKVYSIENNGITPVTVELQDFKQSGSRSGIETLLQDVNHAEDMLFLNLTLDLAEAPIGQDLLKSDGASAPFGKYTELLGAGESWQYSFGGFYYPKSGYLPGTSAISDYSIVLNIELDLSDPDS